MGAAAASKDLQAVRDFAARHRVHVVRPDWLRLCAHERRLVPLPDERCSINIDVTLLARGVGADPAATAGAPPGTSGGGGVFGQAAASRGSLLAAAGGLAGGGSLGGFPSAHDALGLPDFWDAPADNPERLFADCWFTLVALAGDRNAETEAQDVVWCGAVGADRWGWGRQGAVRHGRTQARAPAQGVPARRLPC